MSRIPNSVSILGVLKDDEVLGCTVSSLVSVEVENPELMFVLKNSSATLQALSAVGLLSINVLASSQKFLADYYSKSRAKEIYSEAESRWTCSKDGVVFLEGSLVSFICRVNRLVPLASATLVFCAPIETYSQNESFPLIYADRQFFSVSSHNTI